MCRRSRIYKSSTAAKSSQSFAYREWLRIISEVSALVALSRSSRLELARNHVRIIAQRYCTSESVCSLCSRALHSMSRLAVAPSSNGRIFACTVQYASRFGISRTISRLCSASAFQGCPALALTWMIMSKYPSSTSRNALNSSSVRSVNDSLLRHLRLSMKASLTAGSFAHALISPGNRSSSS